MSQRRDRSVSRAHRFLRGESRLSVVDDDGSHADARISAFVCPRKRTFEKLTTQPSIEWYARVAREAERRGPVDGLLVFLMAVRSSLQFEEQVAFASGSSADPGHKHTLLSACNMIFLLSESTLRRHVFRRDGQVMARRKRSDKSSRGVQYWPKRSLNTRREPADGCVSPAAVRHGTNQR